MTKPRELTTDEVRELFLEKIRHQVGYWATLPNITTKERVEGIAFSILVTLDGESADLPGFVVAPDPHPDDQRYFESQGSNWFPYNDADNVKCDIAGSLHELFYKPKAES